MFGYTVDYATQTTETPDPRAISDVVKVTGGPDNYNIACSSDTASFTKDTSEDNTWVITNSIPIPDNAEYDLRVEYKDVKDFLGRTAATHPVPEPWNFGVDDLAPRLDISWIGGTTPVE